MPEKRQLDTMQALRDLLKTDEHEIAKKTVRFLDRIRQASELAKERLKKTGPKKAG
jgi:hypothetical protein